MIMTPEKVCCCDFIPEFISFQVNNFLDIFIEPTRSFSVCGISGLEWVSFSSRYLLDKRLASSVEFRVESSSWPVTSLVKGAQSIFFSRLSPVFSYGKYFFFN